MEHMSDLLMMVLLVAAVAGAAGYVLACAHLTRPPE
jgi:hypothetical protein